MISWIIFAVVAVIVLLYCKLGKDCGHIPDFRKPFSVVALIVYTIIMLLCCSCRSVQYVPVETIKTKIEYRDRWQRDSIHIHDSIHIRDKGDTVFVDRWHTVYKDKLKRDTSYIEKTDSVQVSYPVEKQLSRWQSAKMELGGWAFGGIILIALVFVGWLVYRWRKK